MKRAALREDATEKSAVTPGPLAPARELLGDMLLELRRPAAAGGPRQRREVPGAVQRRAGERRGDHVPIDTT